MTLTPTARPAARYPTRIVCLTEETTEALYLLGEEERIVAASQQLEALLASFARWEGKPC